MNSGVASFSMYAECFLIMKPIILFALLPCKLKVKQLIQKYLQIYKTFQCSSKNIILFIFYKKNILILDNFDQGH